MQIKVMYVFVEIQFDPSHLVACVRRNFPAEVLHLLSWHAHLRPPSHRFLRPRLASSPHPLDVRQRALPAATHTPSPPSPPSLSPQSFVGEGRGPLCLMGTIQFTGVLGAVHQQLVDEVCPSPSHPSSPLLLSRVP